MKSEGQSSVGVVTFSLGQERWGHLHQLTRQANFERVVHFERALIARLVELTGDSAFDVRDLTLQQRGADQG
jgi:hypothetical protein